MNLEAHFQGYTDNARFAELKIGLGYVALSGIVAKTTEGACMVILVIQVPPPDTYFPAFCFIADAGIQERVLVTFYCMPILEVVFIFPIDGKAKVPVVLLVLKGKVVGIGWSMCLLSARQVLTKLVDELVKLGIQ